MESGGGYDDGSGSEGGGVRGGIVPCDVNEFCSGHAIKCIQKGSRQKCKCDEGYLGKDCSEGGGGEDVTTGGDAGYGGGDEGRGGDWQSEVPAAVGGGPTDVGGGAASNNGRVGGGSRDDDRSGGGGVGKAQQQQLIMFGAAGSLAALAFLAWACGKLKAKLCGKGNSAEIT